MAFDKIMIHSEVFQYFDHAKDFQLFHNTKQNETIWFDRYLFAARWMFKYIQIHEIFNFLSMLEAELEKVNFDVDCWGVWTSHAQN